MKIPYGIDIIHGMTLEPQEISPGGGDLSQLSHEELFKEELNLADKLDRVHKEQQGRFKQLLASHEVQESSKILRIPASTYGPLVKRYILEPAGVGEGDQRIINIYYSIHPQSSKHYITLTWQADLATKVIDGVQLTYPSSSGNFFDVEISSESAGEGTARPTITLWASSLYSPAIQRSPLELCQQAQGLGLGLLNLPRGTQRNLLANELLGLFTEQR